MCPCPDANDSGKGGVVFKKEARWWQEKVLENRDDSVVFGLCCFVQTTLIIIPMWVEGGCRRTRVYWSGRFTDEKIGGFPSPNCHPRQCNEKHQQK